VRTLAHGQDFGDHSGIMSDGIGVASDCLSSPCLKLREDHPNFNKRAESYSMRRFPKGDGGDVDRSSMTSGNSPIVTDLKSACRERTELHMRHEPDQRFDLAARSFRAA
jgi:hypothetical protein